LACLQAVLTVNLALAAHQVIATRAALLAIHQAAHPVTQAQVAVRVNKYELLHEMSNL